MVDTLVLGTSAKAWEFESLHAQIKGNGKRSFFYIQRYLVIGLSLKFVALLSQQTEFYPKGYPVSYGSCCSPTMQATLFWTNKEGVVNVPFLYLKIFGHRTLTRVCCSVVATNGVLP